MRKTDILPRRRIDKLLHGLHGKPFISLRSAAQDVVCRSASARVYLFSAPFYRLRYFFYNRVFIGISFYFISTRRIYSYMDKWEFLAYPRKKESNINITFVYEKTEFCSETWFKLKTASRERRRDGELHLGLPSEARNMVYHTSLAVVPRHADAEGRLFSS